MRHTVVTCAAWNISIIITVCLFQVQTLTVQNITIAGWIPDSPDNFLMKFRPLFEDFLNNALGSDLDPPAKFTLIAAEYTAETSFQNLLSTGRLDFMCKFALLCS
jgi:hypothetical protein